MKSRSVMAVVVVLAILGGGYGWLTKRASSAVARVEPRIEHGASRVQDDPPSALLQIPVVTPPPEVEVIAPVTDETQRAAAPPTAQQGFERKYLGKTAEELRAAAEALQTELGAASKARFDELFPQFPQLLAEGRYGARIAPKDEPIHIKNTPGSRVLFFRHSFVRNADGIEEKHCLELSPAEEPTMASLFEESLWVREQLEKASKKV